MKRYWCGSDLNGRLPIWQSCGVAFAGDADESRQDAAAMLEHLRGLGIEFNQRQVNDQGLYQLFMFDPNGIKIDLNLANTEAAAIRADVVASELTG